MKKKTQRIFMVAFILLLFGFTFARVVNSGQQNIPHRKIEMDDYDALKADLPPGVEILEPTMMRVDKRAQQMPDHVSPVELSPPKKLEEVLTVSRQQAQERIKAWKQSLIDEGWVNPDGSQKYVPGEVVVQFENDARSSVQPQTRQGVAVFGITSVDRINEKYNARSLERVHKPENVKPGREASFMKHGLDLVYIIEFAEDADVRKIADEYLKDAAVKEASPNWKPYPCDVGRAVPDDPWYVNEDPWIWDDDWYPEAWNVQTGVATDTARVCHICLEGAPDTLLVDLSGNYAHVWGGTSYSITNHATSCIGAMVARSNNTSYGPGASGGWGGTAGCRFTFYGMAAAVTSEAAAFIWAADHGCVVANCSFSSGYPGAGNEAAANYAVDNGCLITASAGNDGYPEVCFPAHFGNVMAVGGTQRGTYGDECIYNFHEQLSILATGSVWGLGYNDQVWGTSFAAPKIAGMIGLMKSQHPGWDVATIRKYAEQCADWIDYIPYNYGLSGLMGGGRENPYEAMMVYDRNVSLNRIFSPMVRWSTSDTLPQGKWIYPQVVVQNRGINKVTFPVHFEIRDSLGVLVWADTVLVDGLTKRSDKVKKGRLIEFDRWNTGTGPNRYEIKAYTALTGDQNAANDMITDMVYIPGGAAAVIDTLMYETSGVTWYHSYSNYWAVRMSPAQPCSVIGVIWYSYAFAAGGTYDFYTWYDDGSGQPGTSVTGPQTHTWSKNGWLFEPLTTVPWFTGDFHLGFQATGDPNGPYCISDDGPGTGRSNYSSTGTSGSWTPRSDMNFSIRAVVKYMPNNDDVMLSQLIRPTEHEMSQVPFIPQAVVKNVGINSQSPFDIILRIDSSGTIVYADTVQPSQALDQYDQETISFTGYAPQADSFAYAVKCTTLLSGDQDNSNDAVSRTMLASNYDTIRYDDNAVWYYWIDTSYYWAVTFHPDRPCSVVGMDYYLWYGGTAHDCSLFAYEADTDTPTTVIWGPQTAAPHDDWNTYNFTPGQQFDRPNAEDFSLVIWTFGRDTIAGDTVCPRSDATDEAPWHSYARRPPDSWAGALIYDMMFRARVKYYTAPFAHDVSMNYIDNPEPYYFVYPYRPTPPKVTVENKGTNSETFDVVFRITDTLLTTVNYADTQSVTIGVAETKQVTFDDWSTAVTDSDYIMTTYTNLSGDLNRNNDTLTAPIYCRTIDVISYNEEYWGGYGLIDTGMIYYAVKFTPEKPCTVWGAILNMVTMKDSCATPCTLFLWEDTLCRPSSTVMDADTFSMKGRGLNQGGYMYRFRVDFNDTLPPDSNYFPDTCQPIGNFWLGVCARIGTGVGSDTDTLAVMHSDLGDWGNIDGRSRWNLFGYDSTGHWWAPYWISGGDTSQTDLQIKALVKYDNYPCDPPLPPDIMVTKSGNNAVVAWDSVKTDVSGNPTICDHYVAYEDSTYNYVPGLDYFFAEGPDTTFTHTNALLMSTDTINHNYLIYAYDKYCHTSSKSNMGYVLFRDIIENPGATGDKNWVSLPWHCEYDSISHVTADLSPAAEAFNKVTNLDEATQAQYSYFYHAGLHRWMGTNFVIVAGNFYEFTAVKDTTLVLVGSNYPDSGRFLNENTGATGDKNWVGLAYNAAYNTVSDITSEMASGGSPINKVTNLNETTQAQFSYFYHAGLARWMGTNFAIVPGHGYEMTCVKDSTWDPTEYTNDGGGALLARRSRQPDVKMYLGQLDEPDRVPVWSVERRPVNQASRKPIDLADARVYEPVKRSVEKMVGGRVPGISHLVLADLRSDEFENLVFTAYRPDRPYDALTENMVGSGLAWEDDWQVLWFDVANFKEPWKDGEEIVVIIEATKQGRGYFTVLNVKLELGNDPQSVGEITLMPIPEPTTVKGLLSWRKVDNDDVIGYSLYRNDERINERVIARRDYSSVHDDVVLRPVITGGYETVHGSQGATVEHIPCSYAFAIAPNPFARQTRIDYALPHPAEVNVKVYDVAGKLVKTLVSERLEPGYYTIDWRGTDNLGRTVAAGIYFIQMDTKGFESREKVIFVR